MVRKSYEDMPAVVLASAARVNLSEEDPTDLSDKAKRVGHHFAWQRESRKWSETLGEIWFAHAWVGNAMSRVRWEIGLGPDRDPVRDDETNEPLPGMNVVALEAAETALGALQGRAGTQSEWARSLGEALSSQAEGYLIGHAVDEDFDPVPGEIEGSPNPVAVGETWESYAATSVEKRPAKKPTKPGQLAYYVQRSQTQNEWTELPYDTTGIRIWRRHSCWPDDPSGPMRALLPTCRRLDRVDRSIEAEMLSRVPAGVLLIPQEGLGLQSTQFLYSNPNQTGPAPNEFVTEYLAGMMTPIEDSSSGAQFIPTPIATRAEFIDKWKWLKFARDSDPEMAAKAERYIRRLATGLDLPPEVLTGLATSNHWNSWLIDENSWRIHLAPMAGLIADGVSVGYLWPALRADNIDRAVARTFYVRANPVDLVAHPDRSVDAEKAFDRGAISWSALRAYKGFPETDKPDPEELLERVEYGFIPHGKGAINPVDAGSTPGDTGNNTVTPGPPSSANAPPSVQASALVSDCFTQAVGQIECSHLRDVLVAADGAVDHALDMARKRLRSWANGDPTLKAQLTKAPNESVPVLLGRRNVDALVAGRGGYAALFAGSFDSLVNRYRRMTADAQASWRELVSTTYGMAFSDEDTASMTSDALASEAVLEAGVAAVAAARLMDPEAHAVTNDEQPSGVTIPASVVRRAAARAGGGAIEAGVAPLMAHEGGLCSGKTTSALLSAHGLRSTGSTWVYGQAPRRGIYQPHRVRDGATLNGDGHHPGEVAGCCCVAISSWERSR